MDYEYIPGINADAFIIRNLNALYHNYGDYRMRTLLTEDYELFDEFCINAYNYITSVAI